MEESKGHQIYDSDHHKDQASVPFLVSDAPLSLDPKLVKELQEIGHTIVAYMDAVSFLYKTHQDIHELLDHGKPSQFHGNEPNYLFVRPDLIITPQGFKICEIEVSPFGLALSDILGKAYSDRSLAHDPEFLKAFVAANTPASGTFIYSDKTQRFAGQLGYLADAVYGDRKDEQGNQWNVSHIRDHANRPDSQVYRGYYLHEAQKDSMLEALTHMCTTLPSPTPFFEEKALLALIWDTRFAGSFNQLLGDSDFARMRELIPPTWIVGQEQYFEPGLPGGATTTLELAGMGKKQRQVVIKSSGYCDNMSWGHGVHFLDKVSGASAIEHIAEINNGLGDSLYIGQQYCPPEKVSFTYFTNGPTSEIQEQAMGCRITPYYCATGSNKGELLTVKATGRNGSRYIHAATDSVNTAVGASSTPLTPIERVPWHEHAR
ncbi:MAG TPA: hypothetical protein PLT55_00105 [Acidimicrobiia bacterium]|nr:hypothetical protein [Acidimicrobiia bacterium]